MVNILRNVKETYRYKNWDERVMVQIRAILTVLDEEYGVNRISLGLQAWQDSLLKTIGRVHTRAPYDIAQGTVCAKVASENLVCLVCVGSVIDDSCCICRNCQTQDQHHGQDQSNNSLHFDFSFHK